MSQKLRAALAPNTHPGSLIRFHDRRTLDGWLAVVDEVTDEGVHVHAEVPLRGTMYATARHGTYDVVGYIGAPA